MNGTQLVLFDYSALDADTRSFVETRTVEIKLLVKRTGQDLFDIGRYVTEIKQRLGHGNFGLWRVAEFGWSERTARNLMSIYENFKSANFADLNIATSAMYLLSAPSTSPDARLEAIERAENGERITYTTAKEIVSRRKDDPPIISNDLGSYTLLAHDTKQCETCGSLWAADLDYCPYCHLPPEVRVHYAQKQETIYRLPAANHALSDDPDYDGDEWYTPLDYIEAARRVLGEIDLDPASCIEAQSLICAERYLTKEDDALRDDIQWCGRVWLNPPYSTPLIRSFVAKLIAQHDAGNVTEAIILTNNSSDTGWFHDLLSRYPACFTRGRAQFWRAGSVTFGARQGQTLFYLGDHVPAFVDVFGPFGQVVVKA